MAMSRTPEGRAKLRAHGKKPAPVKVAQEFMHADKGKHFKQPSHYAGHVPGWRQDCAL